MPYRKVTIQQLRGLNQDENPASVARDELIVAQNVYRRGNFVGTRPGVQALGSGDDYEDAITDGNPIRGAHEYRAAFDASRTLLTISEADVTNPGQDIWYEDGSQLPTGGSYPTISADQDYIWSISQHNANVYFAGGPPGKSQVQTEDFFYWDGNTGNAPVKLDLTDKGTGAELYPKFVRGWRNYLLIAGLQQTVANRSASNNPATVRYAIFGADPTDDANWRDELTVGFQANRIGLDSENYSTGLGTYKDNQGDFLMLLANREIAAVRLDPQGGNDFVVTDTIANGCVHERAFVSLGLDAGEAVFMSDRGFHSLRQSQQFGGRDEFFLSWKIRPFFNSISRSRIHHSVGAYHQEAGFILFAVSTGSSTTHNALMVLDVKDIETLTARNAQWYGPWILNGVTVNHMAYMRDASNEYQMFLFTTDGKVLKLSEETHRDLASGTYQVKLQTAHDPVSNLQDEKVLGDMQVEYGTAQGGFNIQQRSFFDFGRARSNAIRVPMPDASGSTIGSATIGSATIGADFAVVSRKVYGRGRGGTLSHEWSHEGDNESFYVGRIDYDVAVSGESSGSSD